MAIPELTARELEKHLVQAGPLQGHILDLHGKLEQLTQRLAGIPILPRRHDELKIGLLDHAKAVGETADALRLEPGERAVHDEQLAAAEALLQLRQRASASNFPWSMIPMRWHRVSASSSNGWCKGRPCLGALPTDEVQQVQPACGSMPTVGSSNSKSRGRCSRRSRG